MEAEEVFREKSLKEKKLEGILGIGDALKNLDAEENSQVSKDDDEKKRKLEERKKYIAEMKEQFETLKSKSDLDFAKEVYKEMVMIDMEMLRITRKEMEMDPSPRYVETAGSLTNSITATIDSLRDIDEVKVDQGFEREKIDMKKNQGALGTGNNVIMIGSMSDVLKQLKKDTEKTIEAEVVKDVEVKKE
jgi:hypothetical protein